MSYRALVATLASALPPADTASALIMVNVSDLCAVQARLGFEASAEFLQNLAERFGAALGQRATVQRLGDSSICVLVHVIRNAGHAILAAEKLKQEIEEAVAGAALAIPPDMHIGIALSPQHATNIEDLLRKAQLAAAMARGRIPPLQVYDDECARQVIQPWTLGDAFVDALRTGELEVHYQPKIAVADRRPAGAEALLRWMKDGRPVATPDVFIPLAEQAGLIQDTTWYVLTNSVRLMMQPPHLPVAVNVTPGMLHHRDFIEMIRTVLTSCSAGCGALTLEITEGALIVDFEHAIARLAQLRQMGVNISIDDFGTGYSSLSYFKKIPADELKIDKSFISRLLTDKADQHLVEAIISLAHRFNLKVVAEGVENQPTLDALADMGCEFAQGYLFARAMKAADLGVWLAQQSSSTTAV